MSYQPIGSVYRFKMPHEQNKVERGYVLSFFLFVSVCTGVSASLCIIVQVATVLLRDYGENGVTLDVMLHWVVQLYEVLMCMGIIIIEMEMTDVLGSITLLQSWTTRGLMYIFAALLTLEERINIGPTLETCVILAGSCLLASGTTYFIMGALCLKRVRDAKMARYIQLLSHFEVQSVIRNNLSSTNSLAEATDL